METSVCIKMSMLGKGIGRARQAWMTKSLKMRGRGLERFDRVEKFNHTCKRTKKFMPKENRSTV